MKADYETEFYDKVITLYVENCPDKDKLEICRCHLLIKLMENLKETNNREFVKNTLLVINSLYGNCPPDSYNSVGYDIEDLTSEEKEILIPHFKRELNHVGGML